MFFENISFCRLSVMFFGNFIRIPFFASLFCAKFGISVILNTLGLPPSSPLWGMENVLLTPHVSGRGFGHDRGTERLIWEIVMDNLARYLEGKKLRHIVDINRGY